MRDALKNPHLARENSRFDSTHELNASRRIYRRNLGVKRAPILPFIFAVRLICYSYFRQQLRACTIRRGYDHFLFCVIDHTHLPGALYYTRSDVATVTLAVCHNGTWPGSQANRQAKYCASCHQNCQLDTVPNVALEAPLASWLLSSVMRMQRTLPRRCKKELGVRYY